VTVVGRSFSFRQPLTRRLCDELGVPGAGHGQRANTGTASANPAVACSLGFSIPQLLRAKGLHVMKNIELMGSREHRVQYLPAWAHCDLSAPRLARSPALSLPSQKLSERLKTPSSQCPPSHRSERVSAPPPSCSIVCDNTELKPSGKVHPTNGLPDGGPRCPKVRRNAAKRPRNSVKTPRHQTSRAISSRVALMGGERRQRFPPAELARVARLSRVTGRIGHGRCTRVMTSAGFAYLGVSARHALQYVSEDASPPSS